MYVIYTNPSNITRMNFGFDECANARITGLNIEFFFCYMSLLLCF